MTATGWNIVIVRLLALVALAIVAGHAAIFWMDKVVPFLFSTFGAGYC